MRKNLNDLTRLRLLKLIRRQSGISRTELAERASLTKSTVTAIVGDMTETGLICEIVVSAIGRGRPRISLAIAEDRGHAVALFPLSDGTASIDIVNLQDKRLFSCISALGDLGKGGNVKIMMEEVSGVERLTSEVITAGGKRIAYDHLVSLPARSIAFSVSHHAPVLKPPGRSSPHSGALTRHF